MSIKSLSVCFEMTLPVGLCGKLIEIKRVFGRMASLIFCTSRFQLLPASRPIPDTSQIEAGIVSDDW